jgi:hypothetical protein
MRNVPRGGKSFSWLSPFIERAKPIKFVMVAYTTRRCRAVCGLFVMNDQRILLRHFLAALAYRTQKALRDAPSGFSSFRPAPRVRTPQELIRHMDDVLGYSRTFFIGGSYRAPEFIGFPDAIAHFHETLSDVARHIALGTQLREITPEVLLQGPFSDAMTHAGQLALLRRLAGSPVPPENFVFADIKSSNLSPDQPLPARPDEHWPDGPDQ